MKRLMLSVFSIYIFAALLLPEITIAGSPKVIRKIEVPKIVLKKLIADLYVKSVKVDPPCPRAQKDMVHIKVIIINMGTATPVEDMFLGHDRQKYNNSPGLYESGHSLVYEQYSPAGSRRHG